MNLFSWFRKLWPPRSANGLPPIWPNSSDSSTPNFTSAPKKPSDQKKVAQSTKEKSRKQYAVLDLNTPNVTRGKRIRPQAIVLHHTDGGYEGSVDWCMRPESRVSYHAIVAKDGKRTTLADPDERTWHAGVSSWRGRRDLNSWSVGAAFEGNTYKRELGEAEMDSMAQYLVPIMKQYGLTMKDVTDHRTVSPKRKNDLCPTELAKFKAYLSAKLAAV